MTDVMLTKPRFNETVAASSAVRAARPLSKAIVVGTVGAGDAVLLLAAWSIAYFGYFKGLLGAQPGIVPYATLGALGAGATVFLMKSLGWYRFDELRNLPLQMGRITMASTIVMASMVTIGFLSKTAEDWSRGWLICWYFSGISLLWICRGIQFWQLGVWEKRGRFKQAVVLVGDPSLIAAKLDYIITAEFPGIVLGMFWDDPAHLKDLTWPKDWVFGDVDDLLAFAIGTTVDRVIMFLPLSDERRATTLMDRLKFIPCDVRMSFDTVAVHHHYRGLSEIGGFPVLDVYERPLKDWQIVAKRLEDIAISCIGCLMVAPLMLVIAAAIKLDSRGPVLFRQERHGFNQSIFGILKFRTMYEAAGDPTGVKQTRKSDVRITRVGKLLRRWSLDELPQLWNVLQGNMSIVGPRPHPIAMRASGKVYEDLVEDYAARHRVKPGLTGWAQVNGWRGPTLTEESARKRIEHDLDYIENWSFWFDLKIIALTALIVFSRKNAF